MFPRKQKCICKLCCSSFSISHGPRRVGPAAINTSKLISTLGEFRVLASGRGREIFCAPPTPLTKTLYRTLMFSKIGMRGNISATNQIKKTSPQHWLKFSNNPALLGIFPCFQKNLINLYVWVFPYSTQFFFVKNQVRNTAEICP